LFRLQVSIGSHTAGACVTGRSVAKSSSAFRVRSTLQEYAFRDAVWRKARPLFVYRTRKLRSSGPMILGAQAPGKVGHRQVTNEKAISQEIVFSVFLLRVSIGSHTAGVCVISRSVAKGSSAFRFRADDTWSVSSWENRIHTAGVCVMSRSVAIGSSAYRIAR